VLNEERPPSLLTRQPVSPGMLAAGAAAVVVAHLIVPVAMMISQWLLVFLGLAIPVDERKPVKLPTNMIAAEFVRLGKPFDPTKLPNRKVPPVAKRTPDGVVVSKDATESEPKPEDKKDRPLDAQDSLLDNLVDRTKEFAEDVTYEQEGDPQGLAEGTATTAQAGNIYLGQLTLFFRRGWTVPNVVQSVEGLSAIAAVEVASDGRIQSVTIQQSSGDPLFDQSVIDRVQELIAANASIPEPPAELRDAFYDSTLPVRFRGADVR
jgi:hypothetical protein